MTACWNNNTWNGWEEKQYPPSQSLFEEVNQSLDLQKMQEEKSALTIFHLRIKECAKRIKICHRIHAIQTIGVHLETMRRLELENPNAHAAYVDHYYKDLKLQFPNWNMLQ